MSLIKNISKSIKKYQKDAPKRMAANMEKQKRTLELERTKTALMKEKMQQHNIKSKMGGSGGSSFSMGLASMESKNQKRFKGPRIGI